MRAAEPARELRWEGSLFVVGVFDGDHRFLLEETPDGGTRVTQDERFRGILVPFMIAWLNDNTRSEFDAMNAALAKRAESAVRRLDRQKYEVTER